MGRAHLFRHARRPIVPGGSSSQQDICMWGLISIRSISPRQKERHFDVSNLITGAAQRPRRLIGLTSETAAGVGGGVMRGRKSLLMDAPSLKSAVNGGEWRTATHYQQLWSDANHRGHVVDSPSRPFNNLSRGGGRNARRNNGGLQFGPSPSSRVIGKMRKSRPICLE